MLNNLFLLTLKKFQIVTSSILQFPLINLCMEETILYARTFNISRF